MRMIGAWIPAEKSPFVQKSNGSFTNGSHWLCPRSPKLLDFQTPASKPQDSGLGSRQGTPKRVNQMIPRHLLLHSLFLAFCVLLFLILPTESTDLPCGNNICGPTEDCCYDSLVGAVCFDKDSLACVPDIGKAAGMRALCAPGLLACHGICFSPETESCGRTGLEMSEVEVAGG
jgi:hypothetical protein